MTSIEDYGLVCPQCLGSELAVRSDDVTADGGFIGDPEAICIRCGAMLRVSELIPVESGDGHTLHMVRGGDAT